MAIKQKIIATDDISDWDDDEQVTVEEIVPIKPSRYVNEKKSRSRGLQQEENSTLNWQVKYAVKSFQELKLHHAKVKFLKEWLNKNALGNSNAKLHLLSMDNSKIEQQFPTKLPLLVIYGNSGSGKSTAIQLLCEELGISVHPWNLHSSSSSLKPDVSRRRASTTSDSILKDFYDDDHPISVRHCGLI